MIVIAPQVADCLSPRQEIRKIGYKEYSAGSQYAADFMQGSYVRLNVLQHARAYNAVK